MPTDWDTKTASSVCGIAETPHSKTFFWNNHIVWINISHRPIKVFQVVVFNSYLSVYLWMPLKGSHGIIVSLHSWYIYLMQIAINIVMPWGKELRKKTYCIGFATLPFLSGVVVKILKNFDNASFVCSIWGEIPNFKESMRQIWLCCVLQNIKEIETL